MIIGVDGYCFHRYFGEVYPDIEEPPDAPMTVAEMIGRVGDLGADAVSVESFMLGDEDSPQSIRRALDAADLQVMWAWGHPDGLGSGTDPGALEDLYVHLDHAAEVGASVMRICAGGRRNRLASWERQRDLLRPLLEQATERAERRGVVLAMENHIDLTAAQAVELVELVDSPWFGLCLDTGNQLRMLEDPREAISLMAPHARACHFKDVTAYRGDPTSFAFWPSVPVGEGVIELDHAVSVLAEHGYSGILALELDYLHPSHPSLDDAISTSLLRMRELVDEFG